MKYNSNDPNSYDQNGENTTLYKETCEWDPEFG